MKKEYLFIVGVFVILVLASLVLADVEKNMNKEITTNRGTISITKTITRDCYKEDNKIECAKNMYKEIAIEREDNKTRIRSKNVTVTINGEIETDDSNKTYFKLNNKTREIKIMPDTASDRAIERLRIKVCSEANNCTIILKDTGIRNMTTNQTKLVYEIKAWKERKFLFWKWKKLVKAEVDAETGIVS